MAARALPELVEAFLIVEQPRQRLGHWLDALAALDDRRAPALAAVAAHYDPTTDQALLELRYEPHALGSERLKFVVEVALLAEIGMIQPAELSEGDRKRFVAERLARCEVTVDDQDAVGPALSELVRQVRERHNAVPLLARAAMRPRGNTEDPVLLVQPRSTRDDLTRARGTRDVERTARQLSPHVVPRSQHRTRTVEISPDEAARLIASLEAPRESVHARGPASPSSPPPSPSSPPSPPSSGVPRARSPSSVDTMRNLLPPATIHARYLRSGRWLPIRVGALSLRGASLVAGALPRQRDPVDLSLAFGEHRAQVRGTVTEVSAPAEAAQPTFGVAFDLDATARRQLTQLLTAARTANITIKPPPGRQARRLPVEWPIALGTMRGAVRATALDVSRAGMFVRPTNALTLDVHLTYSVVLDDGREPVSGRAKIARQVAEPEARDAGLAAGYGLELLESSDADRARWQAFLGRIEQRTERRILVGASPARLTELHAVLTAAGYAITSGSDPSGLAQLATSDARAVDACVIDAAWLASLPADWVEDLCLPRGIPWLTLHGDARRARAAVDKLLGIA